MSVFAQEIRLALRGLVRTPWFSLTALLMLAAGLGMCLYMFGAIQSFIFTQPAFHDPDQVLYFDLRNQRSGARNVDTTLTHYEFLRERQTSLASIGAFYVGTANLSDADRPERLSAGFVTPSVLEVAGTSPVLGRSLQPTDGLPGAAPVVLLSHAVWQNRYGADPSIIGRDVRVNGQRSQVVGVMPERFSFPAREALWIPLRYDAVQPEAGGSPISVQIVGRMQVDARIASVQSEFDALLRSHAEEHPARKAPDGVVLKKFSHQFVNEITRGILLTMFAAVVLVLVMACTNVANLFVARSVARLRETAICSAIGASRTRLLTRLVAEAGVLSLLAAALGFGMAQWAGWATVRAVHASEDAPPNWTAELVIDGWSFLAAAALALLATLAASAIPALRLMRSDLNQALRSGGAGSIGGSAMGRKLVVFQVALCTVLLVCSGLTILSAVRQQTVEPGVRTEGVLTGRAGLFQGSYPDDAALTRFAERLQSELRTIPGVTHATLSTSLPMTRSSRNFIEPEGFAVDAEIGPPLADAVAVDSAFFDAFAIAQQSGRGFSSTDLADSLPVAIVSRGFAAAYWPGLDPIGQRLRLGRDESVGEWRTVVGVVGDVHHEAEDAAGQPRVVYTPLAQTPARFLSFALIGPADTDSLHDAVRAAVQRVDPDLPVYWLRSLDDWIRESRFENELLAMLFGAFGLFALFLTAAGIYAVLAHSISQRQREIGVRRALGADNRGLLRMLVGQNGRLLGIGLAFGLVGALLFSPLLQRVLFAVDPRDPQAVGMALAALLVTVAIAAVVPVRRALRVEPMAALRQD